MADKQEKFLVFVEGQEADAGQLDDWGEAKAVVVGGIHTGHTVTMYTEKHNCGAYGTEIKCSCGAAWQSAMHGCWQQGHQREKEGDLDLATLTSMEYLPVYPERARQALNLVETADSFLRKRATFTQLRRAVEVCQCDL